MRTDQATIDFQAKLTTLTSGYATVELQQVLVPFPFVAQHETAGAVAR